MYHYNDAITIILEERHQELITHNYLVSQLKGSDDSRKKSWATGQLGELLKNLRRTSLFDWLLPEPVPTTQISFEMGECQGTSKCQSS